MRPVALLLALLAALAAPAAALADEQPPTTETEPATTTAGEPEPPQPPKPEPQEERDAKALARGLERAVARGWATPEEAAARQEIVDRATAALAKLDGWRFDQLAGALHDVAAQWRALTPPRALALFATLDLNVRYFGSSGAWRSEIEEPDGAVYRLFSGHGFQFHPLATASALNREAAAGHADATRRIADALLARALRVGPALVFPYWFPYGSGEAPWRSGMAQAVGAQALARTADLVDDPRLRAAARKAFLALPHGLLRGLDVGPWVRLYGFDDAAVLNAQLQTVLSLDEYAERTGDGEAASLAERLQLAARDLLPSFDTGAWSLYSLGGAESSLGYHEYVVDLLRKLGKQADDPVFADAAQRFERYTEEPPTLRAGPPPGVIYPRPKDGFRDAARLVFWVSKRSQVTLHAGGAPVRTSAARGWNTLEWSPGPRRAPGVYAASLTALGPAGHRTQLELPPLEVRRETGPPQVEASLVNGVLRWKAVDEATPWLALRVRLRAGGSTAVRDLGKRKLQGSARVRIPAGRWGATLLAANSAGWTAQVRLGVVSGGAR